MSSIVEAEPPPSPRDYILGGALGKALAGFDVQVNVKADPAQPEAYLENMPLRGSFNVGRHGQWVDRARLYASCSEKHSLFRIRVLFGRIKPGTDAFVHQRKHKFQYSASFQNHEAEREAALDLAVKQYTLLHDLLSQTKFTSISRVDQAVLQRGFLRYS